MKLFYLIAILLITITNVFTQNSSVVVVNSEDIKEFPDEWLTAKYVGAEFKNMRLQFLEDWKWGEVTLTNGKVFKNQRIRFNNYLNELIWLRETDYKVGILIKESIKEFTFYPENGYPGATYKKFPFTKSIIAGEKELYFQMLVEEKDTIVCYRKYNKIGQTEDYKLSNQYYLIRNGEFSRFYLQRSSIYNLFAEPERQKMKSLIRSNHLKVRKEDKMIKAFELFYNN